MLVLRATAVLSEGFKWRCRHFVDCDTVEIIYLLQCPCWAFYVGKTRRPFKRHMYDHNYVDSIGYFRSPLGRHIAFAYNYKFEGFSFLPLEIIHLPLRGGDWNGTILRVETKWIFRLRAHLSSGLIENISYDSLLHCYFVLLDFNVLIYMQFCVVVFSPFYGLTSP